MKVIFLEIFGNLFRRPLKNLLPQLRSLLLPMAVSIIQNRDLFLNKGLNLDSECTFMPSIYSTVKWNFVSLF